MTTDYEKAKELGLTSKNRWEEGIEHHPESEKLFEFIEKHDLRDNDDYFCWKSGGDGDNGEFLMYLMDAYFELKELESEPKPFNPVLLNFDLDQELYLGYPKGTKFYKKDNALIIEYSNNLGFILMVDNYQQLPLIKIPDHGFGVKLVSQFLKGDK